MNEMYEIYNMEPVKGKNILALDVKTCVYEIYQEAHQNQKIIKHSYGIMAPTVVIECIDPRIVKGTELSKWLCMALKKSEEGIVATRIPDHLTPTSLQTTLYRTAKILGVKAKVVLQDGTIGLQRKEEKPAPVYKEKKPAKPRFLSRAALFKQWVNSLEWDMPVPLPANADLDYYAQLASKYYGGIVKFKSGIVTKHSLCLAKRDGFVVVLYKGLVIYTSASRSLTRINETDKAGINLVLQPHSKTLEDIR